jgi:hypothetical protein
MTWKEYTEGTNFYSHQWRASGHRDPKPLPHARHFGRSFKTSWVQYAGLEVCRRKLAQP